MLFPDEAARRWISDLMGVADVEDVNIEQLEAGVAAAQVWLMGKAAKLRAALAELIHAQTGGVTVVPEHIDFWPDDDDWPECLGNPNVFADAKIAWFVARTELAAWRRMPRQESSNEPSSTMKSCWRGSMRGTGCWALQSTTTNGRTCEP